MPGKFGIARVLLLLSVVGLASCQQDPSVRRDRYFQEAQEYAEKKEYRKAKIQLQNAVKADPNFIEGHFHLGLTRKQLREWPEAAKTFQRVLELDPNHSGAAVELGEIYLRANAPQPAREQAEAVLSREPQNASARILLGKSYLGEKSFPQAKAEFQKAKQLEPDNPAIDLAMGIAEIGAGNRPAAEIHFTHALALDRTRVETYQNLANLYLSWNRPEKAEAVLQQGTQSIPESTRIHLALADFYLRTGRLPAAASLVESLKKKSGDRARLLSELGDFWVAHNQVARAVPEYRASWALGHSELAEKKLVNAYITQGDILAATRWNKKVLQRNPKDRQGTMFQGAIAHLRGDTAGAISQLEAAVAQDPASIFAHYYLGVAYLAEGKLAQAQAHFYECVKYDENFVYAYLRLAELSLRKNEPATAAEYAKKVVILNPWMVEGYLLAADVAMAKQDTVRAQRALQIAERLAPESSAVQERWGVLYLTKKNYARAERAYARALASSSRPRDTLARLTRSYIEHRQFSKALEQVQGYIDSRGPTPALYELLAQLHLARGAWREAVAASEEALALDPKRPGSLVYRGQALARQGRPDEAVRSYERAVQVSPEYLPAHLLLADVSWQQGKLAQATAAYQRALAIDAGSAVALTGMALVLADTGQELNRALSLAQQARELRPEEAAVWDALAWVYHKRGMNARALSLLQECVAKDPKNPVFQYHLAMVYVKSGRVEEGRRWLQAALKNGLASPYEAGARDVLFSLGG